jgi:hypothetical protein
MQPNISQPTPYDNGNHASNTTTSLLPSIGVKDACANCFADVSIPGDGSLLQEVVAATISYTMHSIQGKTQEQE